MSDVVGVTPSNSPFSGLVICVTGLTKETRKQVKEITEQLGGKYSPSLHPQCTHLVVESTGGRKLDHALKHGLSNGLHLVTLGWFLDSVRRNVRLSELSYALMDSRCCESRKGVVGQESENQLLGCLIYVDSEVSSSLRGKVVDAVTREGGKVVDRWFVGCGASYVVCERSSVYRYLGHCDNIVSPVWVLKTAKERSRQRFGGVSTDLARQVGMMLENLQHVSERHEGCNVNEQSPVCKRHSVSQADRLQIVKLAKCGVRDRRARRLQKCEMPLRPINPSSLLDSICWSVSEPTSTAALYAGSRNDSRVDKDVRPDEWGSVASEVPSSNTLRPLTEIEKTELVFKNPFLTILFPIDRFSEMGPSSRTYFSESGFTCSQLLDFIYKFYQENMSDNEIEAAIHTDSRHADQLREVYCSEELGILAYKRIDFLGSRKSFEMLKRISGDNNSNVYELLLGA